METTRQRIKKQRLNSPFASSSVPSDCSSREPIHSASLPSTPGSAPCNILNSAAPTPSTSASSSVHEFSIPSKIQVHEPVSVYTTAPAAQMELALQLQPQQLVDWLSVQNPTNTLKLIHETADQRYREIKKRKQAELQPKVDQAIASKDKNILKKQKKKNDNHASAVASRDKNIFIVNQLDHCCRLSLLISAKAGAGYTDLRKQLEAVKEENERLKQQLSSTACRNGAPNASPGGPTSRTTTNNNCNQRGSRTSERNGATSDDVKRTSTWDASDAPIITSHSVNPRRPPADACPQSQASSQSPTISKLTTLPRDARDSKSCGTAVSDHMNTTAKDIFGTPAASADNLDMFLPWSVSCTGHATIPTSALFQSIADDHLQNDSVQTDANHPDSSIMPLTTGSILVNSTQTSNSVGFLQEANDPTGTGVMENDQNAANVIRSSENFNVAHTQMVQNEPFEYSLDDHSGMLLEKLDITCDDFLVEPEFQEQLRKRKPASDNYALGA